MNKKPFYALFSRLTGLLLGVALLISGVRAAQAGAQAQPPFLPGSWTKLAGNPVLNTGAAGTWSDKFTFAPAVLLDGATYKMWYAAGSTANAQRKIGYATSPDGLAWTRQGANPVLNPGPAGAWDEIGVSFPAVIKDGAAYKMWYTGMDAAGAGRVGYATSPDGVVWTKYAGNPVLTLGAGSWDATYAGMVSVVKTGASYRLWYRGGSATGGGIGYATSPDGLAWTKYASNPVIGGGSGAWDDTPYHPEVLFDGLWYHLWYSGCNPAGDTCQMGYATSTDGAHWTRQGLSLPQGQAGAWDDESADHAAVLLVGSTLKMWYSGFDGAAYRIGLASTSAVLLNHSLFIPVAIR